MSNDKKERKMTPKGFLTKTNSGKALTAASAFLAAHRQWLLTGELAPIATPILRKLDVEKQKALTEKRDTEALAKASLAEIQAAVLGHIIAKDTAKFEATLNEDGTQKTGGGTSKAWVATIYNSKGEVQTRIKETTGEVEDLIKGFDDASSADRWVDRRLFDGAVDWYGEVVNEAMNLRSTIERADSIARILKKPKGPTMWQRGKSTKTLGFGVKAKGDRFSFSRG